MSPRTRRTDSPPSDLTRAARDAIEALQKLSRPAGAFDASRYFRGEHGLEFYNVGTKPLRALARSIHDQHRDRWTIDDAMGFAEVLLPDPHLEAKGLGIEVLARYRRSFRPPLLDRWKRWLAHNHCANWATTDAVCGLLIGPLLVQHPELAARLSTWSTHRNLWVRRASVVGLIPLARTGAALDVLYANARRLHGDPHDLIHKAVGWALREAGKTDPRRLERYLCDQGPKIPRTTLRYAIERFPAAKRAALLRATRP
jgi:3-methyladenine DNA glycosylase AlkD